MEYARRYNCDTLVETGTNRGDTVEAIKDYFKDVYSIEIGPVLYEAAKNRFRDDSNVHLILGDAREALGPLLRFMDPGRRVLFYLDAHCQYDDTSPEGRAEGTSVPEEIKAIFHYQSDSVVLVDDARLFNGRCGWPKLESTIRDIQYLAVWNVELKNDMIRLTPR